MSIKAGVYWCRLNKTRPEEWDGVVVVTGDPPLLQCVARPCKGFAGEGLCSKVVTDPSAIEFGPRIERPPYTEPVPTCPV